MAKINAISLGEGFSLGLIKNEKFKSNLISIYFERALKREEATKISLLTNLMSVGTEKFPTMKDISLKLDELFGMSMNIGTTKHGEKAMSFFKFLVVSDSYVDENIFEKAMEFISEVILNPLIVGEKLNPEMLNIEKDNLRDEINSSINDKRNYANIRCVQEMCSKELYSINQTGYIEDLEEITSEDMLIAYKDFIESSNIYILIESDIEENKIKKICEEKFIFPRKNVQKRTREEYDITPEKVNYVNEHIGTNQGKLVIGCRTGVDYKDFDRYYSFMVGNSIFGGGPHSKLFKNVREKESICYYASSNIEKCKAIMLVSSGIDVENYDKALNLIRIELEAVKNGKFSDLELENAKKSIINTLKTVNDSISGESDFVYNQYVSETDLTLDDVAMYIEKVTKESIIESMKGIKEDTVFFLS